MPVGDGGATLAAHLRQAARTKRVDEDSYLQRQINHEFPYELSHVFDVFQEISECRTSDGMGGVPPVSFRDIKDWQDLVGIVLNPWEVSVIRELDRLWIKTWNDRPSRTRNQN